MDEEFRYDFLYFFFFFFFFFSISDQEIWDDVGCEIEIIKYEIEQ